MNILSETCHSRTLFTHDDIPMVCDCCGEGGTLLLFVHGWTCRRSYWLPQIKYFSATHAVAAPDLPGHGDSGIGGRMRWGVDCFARDVADCVTTLAAKKVVLIGHSMGGAVALEAARLLGSTVAGVVLVDTFVIDYGGLSSEVVESLYSPFQEDFTAAMADLVTQTSTITTPLDLKTRLIRDMSVVDPAWALPAWRDLLQWSPMEAFEQLQMPIYAINGALISSSARQRCAPFVTESLIPNAGHFLQMEDPLGFNRALEKVLTRLG